MAPWMQEDLGLPVDTSYYPWKRKRLFDAVEAMKAQNAPQPVEEPQPQQPEFQGPIQPSRAERLQAQIDAMEHPQPLTLKQKILQGITMGAPLLLGGLLGGSEGLSGAAAGVNESMQAGRAERTAQHQSLLQQMEQERQREDALRKEKWQQTNLEAQRTAQQGQLDIENQLARDRLAEQVRQANMKESVPGRDVPFLPEVFEQQMRLKAPAPVAGRDVPLSQEVFEQQQALKKPTALPGRDIPYPPAVEDQRKRMAASSASASGQQLTPEGLDAAAMLFATTGQMPALGMGAAGMRAQIINRAAQLVPKVDLAGNQAAFSANKTSLTQLQRNRDAVVSFERTAMRNLDLFTSTAKRIVDTGSPWINQPLRTVNRAGLGSADLAAFDAARRVAINEVAKVTSNPNLTGQLSDAARREVEQFIPENATLKQIYAVVNTLKQDMTNRHQSLDEQINAIQDRIHGQQEPSVPQEGGRGAGAGTPAPGGAVRIKDPKTGRTGTFHGTAAEAKAAGYEVIR